MKTRGSAEKSVLISIFVLAKNKTNKNYENLGTPFLYYFLGPILVS